MSGSAVPAWDVLSPSSGDTRQRPLQACRATRGPYRGSQWQHCWRPVAYSTNAPFGSKRPSDENIPGHAAPFPSLVEAARLDRDHRRRCTDRGRERDEREALAATEVGTMPTSEAIRGCLQMIFIGCSFGCVSGRPFRLEATDAIRPGGEGASGRACQDRGRTRARDGPMGARLSAENRRVQWVSRVGPGPGHWATAERRSIALEQAREVQRLYKLAGAVRVTRPPPGMGDRALRPIRRGGHDRGASPSPWGPITAGLRRPMRRCTLVRLTDQAGLNRPMSRSPLAMGPRQQPHSRSDHAWVQVLQPRLTQKSMTSGGGRSVPPTSTACGAKQTYSEDSRVCGFRWSSTTAPAVTRSANRNTLRPFVMSDS